MRERVCALLTVALLGVVPCASASAQRLPNPVFSDGPPASGWHLDQCIGGLTYGGPHKLAVAWGGGLLHESMTNGNDTCIMAVGKVGFGAASASVGVGRSIGPIGSGVALTGGVLRTFSGSLNTTPRRTYVGGSVHVWPLVAIGGEIGYYVRVGDASGASDFQRHVITWSAGFGF